MFDVGEQVDDRDELAVLEPAADEAGVAVRRCSPSVITSTPALILGGDDSATARSARGGVFRLRDAAFEPAVQGLQQPGGPGASFQGP